jgi:hypothetical protein
MPRFVVLEHDHPVLHWDLMLECGQVLRTWRLAEPPAPGKTIRAEALADHRLHYLDYEGSVSGDRGSVKRHLRGTYDLVAETPDMVEINCHSDLIARLKLARIRDNDWYLNVL